MSDDFPPMNLEKTPPPDVRRALVVDDYPDSALALTMLLNSLGWEADSAGDGIEALRKANAMKPDLVLLDIGMPKLDGFDTCGVLRAQPWAEKTCLVAVTGLPEEEVRERAEAVGFDAFLIKPVDPDEILKLLDPKSARSGRPSPKKCTPPGSNREPID